MRSSRSLVILIGAIALSIILAIEYALASPLTPKSLAIAFGSVPLLGAIAVMLAHAGDAAYDISLEEVK